ATSPVVRQSLGGCDYRVRNAAHGRSLLGSAYNNCRCATPSGIPHVQGARFARALLDRERDRHLQKFTSTGMFLPKWGSPVHTADGQFNGPEALVVRTVLYGMLTAAGVRSAPA